jgi:3,4-dihydroxy 2-butanone 4-phosphate synthase/GTP cyclohydrolase II
MRRIEQKGLGVVVYMKQEGREMGPANKLLAYKLKDEGLNVYPESLRLTHTKA